MSYIDIEIPFDEAENYFKPNNKEKLNRLFYKDSNYNKLLRDTTYYLIGEKGSGKTTYCAYFCNNTINNTRSKRYLLTVDDYNKILKMKKEGKLNYTHYVTLWKAILLTKLLSSIEQNEIALFNSRVYDEIMNLLNKYNFSKITMESFSPVSFMDNEKFTYGINGGLNGDKSKIEALSSYENSNQATSEKYVYEDNWLSFVNTIATEIERLRLKNNHYLFIDGLDTRPTDIDYTEYKECIYPLVRAVYDLNNDIFAHIKDRNKGRLQIILLTRLDIFLKAGLSNAGSKISDNSAFLNWSVLNQNDYSASAIFELVNSMLRAGDEQEENKSWDDYFDFEIKRGSRKYASFNYFLRLTTSKPRDFVKLLKITKEQCERNNLANPTSKIIESDLFQRSYSTYFVDSVRSALSFYYNAQDIKLLFEFIKSIRSRSFIYEEYENKWNSFREKEKIEQRFESSNKILELMFDFNMIAMQENDYQGMYYRWKYRETTIANYDYNLDINQIENDTKFLFHWALEKEFGLYLV